jgi:ribosomal protein L34
MNQETLWAREGDVMLKGYPGWSPFSSLHSPRQRALARQETHGFNFRVESDNGSKQMVFTDREGS